MDGAREMGSALDGGTGNGKGGKVVRLGQAGTGTDTGIVSKRDPGIVPEFI